MPLDAPTFPYKHTPALALHSPRRKHWMKGIQLKIWELAQLVGRVQSPSATSSVSIFSRASPPGFRFFVGFRAVNRTGEKKLPHLSLVGLLAD
jgi:hypothetical protein